MIRSSDLSVAVTRWRTIMAALEQPLNTADAQLGDGDTGGMLARLVGALAAVPREDDIGLQCTAFGKAAAIATGSSLGNLIATGLMAVGRATKGHDHIVPADLGGLLGVARDAMLERGQATLGDKTAIDLLDWIARAIQGKMNLTEIAASAAVAADESLAHFRALPIRTGRARMFGDRTIGHDDPGMLAFALLTKALATGI